MTRDARSNEADAQGQGSFPNGASESVLGKNAALSGKSAESSGPRYLSKQPQPQADTTSIIGPQDTRSNSPLSCPECGSQRLYKAGFRPLVDGAAVQRWLCRNCGYRFSEKGPQGSTQPSQKTSQFSQHVSTLSTQSLKGKPDIVYNRQVCEFLTEGSKNLAAVETRQEKAQREGTAQTADINGKVVEFLWHLKQNGAKNATVKNHGSMLRKLAANTDLTPESVKEYLAKTSEWSDSSKSLCVVIYTTFLKFMGASWEPPKYKPAERMPFIPTEADIDQLIAGCGRKLSIFLQLLKETGARCGEAAMLKWADLDFERRVVRITPEKGSRARILPISSKLISMLNNLPRKSDNVWPTIYSLKSSFYKARRYLVYKLQNPRLKQISLHTFRHWKGTMEYHKTRDVFHVQHVLGHKDLRSTLIYINLENSLFQSTDDEFHVKVAQSLDEACKLLEVGFEYVTDMNGTKLFRKRK
jgi:integrase/recombinase XerD